MITVVTAMVTMRVTMRVTTETVRRTEGARKESYAKIVRNLMMPEISLGPRESHQDTVRAVRCLSVTTCN